MTILLKSAMARIAAVSAEVETSLKEIRQYLREDAEQEEEYLRVLKLGEQSGQHKIGGRGHLTEEISRECEKYEGAHKMASDSNATLHSAMKLHMDNHIFDARRSLYRLENLRENQLFLALC